MKMFRKTEGFTLVELMVVVLIIGILVAIAVPVFLNASASAQQKSCFANQRTIEGAIQTWKSVDSAHVWTAQLINGSDPLSTNSAYLKAVPHCPNNATLFYSTDGTGTVDSDKSDAGQWTHAHY